MTKTGNEINVKNETQEVLAARGLAARAEEKLRQSPAFQRLAPEARASLLGDLGKIRGALSPEASAQASKAADPYAFTLETPGDFMHRRARTRRSFGAENAQTQPQVGDAGQRKAKPAATETLAARAGALSDEIDFPAFVAGLIHGTFDAIVDSAIRQMEAFADLVSAVAKNVDDFTRDNVTANQARDWLAEQYPADVGLDLDGAQPRLYSKMQDDENGFAAAPEWLADFGLEGEELTEELLENQLLPYARRRIGENRLQMLATMVLLGMNRINVKDGSISARVRFRAAARDLANVDYAVSQDPGQPSWGRRGGASAMRHATMISTVGANAQAETTLQAELFGQVKINFESETLPLERFADEALMTMLQRNARPATDRRRQSETIQEPASQPPEPPAATAPEPETSVQPVSDDAAPREGANEKE